MKALSEALGEMWKDDEAKYDNHIAHTTCPFLVNNACTSDEIRPDGCRLYPNTTFGIQTTDCEALTRFKKQRSALKRGRPSKESYHFNKTTNNEAIEPANLTKKQYLTCIAKLRRAGMTEEELKLSTGLTEKTKNNF